MIQIQEKTGYLILAHAIAVIGLLCQIGWLNLVILLAQHASINAETAYESFSIALSLSEIYLADLVIIIGLGLIDLILICKPYLNRYSLRLTLIERPKDEL
jgi:hypothetical protein